MTDKSHDTLALVGASITDKIYQLDPRIAGQGLVWNITRIQRDADKGRFALIERPMSVIPPMSEAERLNIDMDKVARIARLPSILYRPILQVERNGTRYVVDGNHRLTARQRCGLPTFMTYIVPDDVQEEYRVRAYVDGVEVAIPYD